MCDLSCGAVRRSPLTLESERRALCGVEKLTAGSLAKTPLPGESTMRHLDHFLATIFRERMLTRTRSLRLSTLFALVCVAATASGASWVNAQEQFGAVHFPITCKADVQKKFDLAVAMLHAFSFPEAAKTFMAVAGED